MGVNLEIYGSLAYWAFLIVGMIAVRMFWGTRWVDFRMLSLFFVLQYAIYSALVLGPLSDEAVFCGLFLITFVFGIRVVKNRTRVGPQHGRSDSRMVRPRFSLIWFNSARAFLLFYWVARLISYPFVVGELDLSDRLAAQSGNRVIFFLGLAYLPALAICFFNWLGERRFGPLDWVLVVLVAVGTYGSGSKSVYLPILLVFLGCCAMQGRKLKEYPVLAVLSVVAVGGVFIRLRSYFPTSSGVEVLNLVAFRIFSNTDSITYLDVINRSPTDYPYAGLGGISPFVSRRFGYDYEYSPGVWLHGTAYGDFTGFGPNPGILMDYYGNLGWVGLVVPIIFVLYFGISLRLPREVGVAFMSMAYLVVVDVSIFQISLAIWLLVLAVCVAVTPRSASVHSVDRQLEGPGQETADSSNVSVKPNRLLRARTVR